MAGERNGRGMLCVNQPKANHSLPSSVKVKNECSCNSIPPYAFIVWTGASLPLLYTMSYDLEIVFVSVHMIPNASSNQQHGHYLLALAVMQLQVSTCAQLFLC